MIGANAREAGFRSSQPAVDVTAQRKSASPVNREAGRRSAYEVLRSRQDFVRAQSRGRRFRNKHLTLLVLAGPDAGPRVGLTISRKVGNAVVRNKVRRRLREIARSPEARLCASFDYVIVAHPAAAIATFAVLREELQCLLRQAQAWAFSRGSSSP